MSEAAAPEEESPAKRRERKRSTVLVSVKGWPFQDPGRLMVWGWKPSPQKAAKEIKRLRQRFPPEVEWSVEPLTATQARAIRLKPFNLREYIKAHEGAVTGSAEDVASDFLSGEMPGRKTFAAMAGSVS